jgi:O-antigen/teichoic acid export membrane protein
MSTTTITARAGDGDGPGTVRPSAVRLGRQVSGLTTGRALAAAFSAVWLVVGARTLPVRTFGDLALLLSFGAIVSAVSDFGYTTVIADTVCRAQTSVRLAMGAALRRRLPIAAACSVGLGAMYVALASEASLGVVLLFAVSVMATAVYTTANAVLRATGRAACEAVNEVLSRGAVLTVGAFWLCRGGGLVAAVMCYALADVASAILLSRAALRHTEKVPNRDDRSAFQLRRVAPIGLAGVIGTLYYRLDVWVVSYLRGAGAVALYASTYRFFDALLLPAGAAAALVIPATATLGPTAGNAKARRLAKQVALTLAIPSLALAVAGPTVLGLTFGNAYRDGGGVLRILMCAVVPSVIVAVVAPRAVVIDRLRTLQAVLVAFVSNMVVNVIGVHEMGVAGAAWATLVSQVLLAIGLWRLVPAEPRE